MPRTAKNRSISFDPVVFEELEQRIAALKMSRSDFVNRVLRDLLKSESPFIIPLDSGERAQSKTPAAAPKPPIPPPQLRDDDGVWY